MNEISLSPLTMKIAHRDDGGGDWKVYLRDGKDGGGSPVARKAPLTKRQFRFAALNSDEESLTSHSWKVDASPKGDVYIRRRGGNGESHISLHASGEAHMKSTSWERRDDVCHWTWTHGESALHIVFLPKWGAPVADRPNEKLWGRNDFLLGLDQDWGLAVTFMRAAKGVQVNPPAPPRQAFLLARMEMPEVAETLWVGAEQIYPPCDVKAIEGRMSLEAALTGMGGALGQVGERAVLELDLMGTTSDGVGFITPLQVVTKHKDGKG